MISDGGPFDPLEVLVANAIATESGATVRFINAVEADANDERRETITAYHDELAELCTVPTEGTVLADNDMDTILSTVETADVAIMSTSAHHFLYNVVFGAVPDELAENARPTVLLTHSHEPRRHTFIRYLLNRYVF